MWPSPSVSSYTWGMFIRDGGNPGLEENDSFSSCLMWWVPLLVTMVYWHLSSHIFTDESTTISLPKAHCSLFQYLFNVTVTESSLLERKYGVETKSIAADFSATDIYPKIEAGLTGLEVGVLGKWEAVHDSELFFWESFRWCGPLLKRCCPSLVRS